jgi:hypothetical protein
MHGTINIKIKSNFSYSFVYLLCAHPVLAGRITCRQNIDFVVALRGKVFALTNTNGYSEY